MSQHVVEIPGLPPGVEVRRSTRRRRSVTAYREDGRTIVVVPQRMARADIKPYVEARERRGTRSDDQLMARARQLSRRYLDDRAQPTSVRFVPNQRRRWGSCTPLDGTIRLSDRLQPMPAHVLDYVLLHELVHLLVSDHGPDFEAWMQRYPRLLESRAFLAGVDHAIAAGLRHGGSPDPGAHGAGAEPPPGDVVDGLDDLDARDGLDGVEPSDADGGPADAGSGPAGPAPQRHEATSAPAAPAKVRSRPSRAEGTEPLF